MTHNSFKTELNDRVLFFDGETQVTPDRILSLIDQGVDTSGIGVSAITEEITQFNQLVSANKRIQVKDGCKPLTFEWNLPEPYNSWTDDEVIQYIIDQWANDCLGDGMDNQETDLRGKRVSEEIWTYKKLNLIPVLRAIIYIINTLRNQNVVWGVGRGSSVSSYVLYLIGAHDVDSFKYDLDFSEFLR